jgi:hypothetical protein
MSSWRLQVWTTDSGDVVQLNVEHFHEGERLSASVVPVGPFDSLDQLLRETLAKHGAPWQQLSMPGIS